jgi:pimeloyl-ACP methyl ester carboxylesterase
VSALDAMRLAWWLGPWSRGAQPSSVRRRAVSIEGAGGPSYLYAPAERAPRVAWLISPGLHHDGPDDPRMQRFAAALASAGAVVLSPRSPELCRLRLTADAIESLGRARTALAAAPEAAGLPLRVVSVSVGALAALRLAASSPDPIERVVVIGGYADPVAMIASLCGADAEHRDPLNQPVAFLTLLDHVPAAVHDRARLEAAWRWFVRTAWPHEAWKRPGATAHHRAARELVREVDARDRDLFLTGCGVAPGGHALMRAALAAGAYDHLDWRPHAPAVRAEVVAVHGVTDSVMPIAQLDALAAALPSAHTIRLGSFAHSRTVASLPALARDLRALRHVLHALAAPGERGAS